MSLETSSPSNTANPFPLLRLPLELLDAIFEYAYECDQHPEPICRALRAFAEKRCFRDVRVETYQALSSFTATIDRRADLRNMVQTLSLSVTQGSNVIRQSHGESGGREDDEDEEDEDEADEDDEDDEDEDDQRIVTMSQWGLLLRRLSNLVYLELSKVDSAFLEVLLDDTLAPSALQKLSKLRLMDRIAPPLAAPWWPGRLAQYSSLRDIDLLDFDVSPSELTGSSGVVLPNITSFCVSSYELDALPLQDYATLFPNLRRFRIVDEGDGGFGSILTTIPNNIRILSTSSTVEYGFSLEGPAFPVDRDLERFSQVEELHLSQSAFTLAWLDTHLRTLANLRVLHFELWSPVTDAFLLSLVEGPTRLHRLELLGLGYVDCDRYPTITSSDYELPAEAKDAQHYVFPNWFEPEWPAGCSEAGLAKVVEAAQVNGVRLVGPALEAVGYEAAWNREVCMALLLWGKQEADFSEARDFLGDAFEREGRGFFGDEQWTQLMEKERGET
ncbi:hypothetical protein NBRC10513v2_006420 [Rhodotorula toruloides]